MKLLFALLFVACFAASLTPLSAQPPIAAPPNLEALWKKAQGNGKYSMLLKQVYAPDDEGTWGAFNDRGFHPEGAVGNPKGEAGKDINVPAGYRVYAAPYWYIWRDQRHEKRSWGPEQLIGEPNTLQHGDQPTAWASKGQDDQDEWLLLEYPAPVAASGIKIYETYNPGSISKISAFGLDGREEEVWAGQDNPPAEAIFVNQKNFPRTIKTNRIKLYLDSMRVPGWNEIDAVGLIDKAGQTHWASNADCSSTYAGIATPVAVRGGWRTGFVPAQPDLAQLMMQLQQMQADINELRQKAGLPPRPQILPQGQPDIDIFLGGGALGPDIIDGPIVEGGLVEGVGKKVAPPAAAELKEPPGVKAK